MDENELSTDDCGVLRQSLQEHFGDLDDYRRQGSISYRLIGILFIIICAVICGANNLKSVALYASRKKEWFVLVLDLANGVPSYTTFWTVLRF